MAFKSLCTIWNEKRRKTHDTSGIVFRMNYFTLNSIVEYEITFLRAKIIEKSKKQTNLSKLNKLNYLKNVNSWDDSSIIRSRKHVTCCCLTKSLFFKFRDRILTRKMSPWNDWAQNGKSKGNFKLHFSYRQYDENRRRWTLIRQYFDDISSARRRWNEQTVVRLAVDFQKERTSENMIHQYFVIMKLLFGQKGLRANNNDTLLLAGLSFVFRPILVLWKKRKKLFNCFPCRRSFDFVDGVICFVAVGSNKTRRNKSIEVDPLWFRRLCLFSERFKN